MPGKEIHPREALPSNAAAATIVRHRSDMELVLCVQDQKQKHRLMVLKRHVPGLGEVVFQELAAALYSAYSHGSS